MQIIYNFQTYDVEPAGETHFTLWNKSRHYGYTTESRHGIPKKRSVGLTPFTEVLLAFFKERIRGQHFVRYTAYERLWEFFLFASDSELSSEEMGRMIDEIIIRDHK